MTAASGSAKEDQAVEAPQQYVPQNRFQPIKSYPDIAAHLPIVDKLRAFMAISPELLEILRCPACKSVVELKEDGSGLKCVGCHRVYPIRDDIPVMLIDQATIEP